MSLTIRALASVACVCLMIGSVLAGGCVAKEKVAMTELKIGQGAHRVVLTHAEADTLADQLRVLVADPEQRAASGAPEPLQARLDGSVGEMVPREAGNGATAGAWLLSSAGAGLRWDTASIRQCVVRSA